MNRISVVGWCGGNFKISVTGLGRAKKIYGKARQMHSFMHIRDVALGCLNRLPCRGFVRVPPPAKK